MHRYRGVTILIIWVLSQFEFSVMMAIAFVTTPPSPDVLDDPDPGPMATFVMLGGSFALFAAVGPALVLARRRLGYTLEPRWRTYYGSTLLHLLGFALVWCALPFWQAPLTVLIMAVLCVLGFAPPIAVAMWVQRRLELRAPPRDERALS